MEEVKSTYSRLDEQMVFGEWVNNVQLNAALFVGTR